MSAGGEVGAGREQGRRRGRREGGEQPMVPSATFTSYYGHPVVKPSPWEADIPVYFFLGGLAGASSVLAAGADLTGRDSLRRSTRIGAALAIAGSFAALVHDLGRPERFVNMLRVVKPTSPMSVGTWILAAYSPLAGLAATAEVGPRLPRPLLALTPLLRTVSRPAGLGAALFGAGVASYTAILLADTATPSWHAARRELPFVFAGSAAASAGGLGMATAPASESGPARRLAAGGALVELLMERRMEASMGMTAEPLRTGTSGRLLRTSRALTVAGAAGGLLLGGRSRAAATLSGGALLAGSLCMRFGVFEAGQQSARDPRYTIIPQRQRLERLAQAPTPRR